MGCCHFAKSHCLKPENASHKDIWPTDLPTQTKTHTLVIQECGCGRVASLHQAWFPETCSSICYSIARPSLFAPCVPTPATILSISLRTFSSRSCRSPHYAFSPRVSVTSVSAAALASSLCLVISGNPPATSGLLPKMGVGGTPFCSPCGSPHCAPGSPAPPRAPATRSHLPNPYLVIPPPPPPEAPSPEAPEPPE